MSKTPRLFIGGPVDGQVIPILATALSYRVPCPSSRPKYYSAASISETVQHIPVEIAHYVYNYDIDAMVLVGMSKETTERLHKKHKSGSTIKKHE